MAIPALAEYIRRQRRAFKRNIRRHSLRIAWDAVTVESLDKLLVEKVSIIDGLEEQQKARIYAIIDMRWIKSTSKAH